jgi:hypothetical protein
MPQTPGPLTSDKLVTWDLCERRFLWTGRYRTRVPLTRALYVALDAGLRTEKSPEAAAENAFLEIASSPGLDIVGHDVYAVAFHHAKLAGIVGAALRSAWTAPWKLTEVAGGDTVEWQSACYETADKVTRRIALVDSWSDSRRQQEIHGWRTLGEVCALNRTILVTAVTIGQSRDKRRHSAWTRCYRHPRNKTFRFQRKTSEEDFSKTWSPVWREDSGITTEAWLKQMRNDGAITDLVHTVEVPVPRGREIYMGEMKRIAGEMERLPEVPPMRLSGCHGFSPCPFLGVCPAGDPGKFGFGARRG